MASPEPRDRRVKIQLHVPTPLYQVIEDEARARWCTVAQVVREVLCKRYLPEPRPPRRKKAS